MCMQPSIEHDLPDDSPPAQYLGVCVCLLVSFLTAVELPRVRNHCFAGEYDTSTAIGAAGLQ